MKWLRFPAINDKLNGEWPTEKQNYDHGRNGGKKKNIHRRTQFIGKSQFIANIWDKQLRKIFDISDGSRCIRCFVCFSPHFSINGRFRKPKGSYTHDNKIQKINILIYENDNR